MPDKKITDLVDGAPLQPTDEFVVARAGDNFKIDGAEVVAAVTKHDVTLDGNTAGVLALISSGTMTLAGGNNITVSQVGNAVTISGANTAAETQTFIGGISASDTLYTSGTVRITGVGGGVTVSSNIGQRIDISVAAQSVQPETQTFIGGVSASDTLYTSGTVRITGVGGGVTVSSNTGQRVDISVAAQSVQPETQTFVGGIGNSQTTYTSGTVNLSVVAGQLTIRSTTGQAFQFSASQSVQVETQTFLGALANSETTYTSGSVTLSALGALTVRSTTGQHFQFSVPNTSSLSATGIVSISTNGSTISIGAPAQTGISGLANSETTYTSGSVTLSALGAITIRSTTGQHFQLSVNAQTVQTQNAVDVTLSGNTAGVLALISSGTLTLAGGNNIILSQAGNAVTISASSQSVQVETQTFLGAIQNSQTTYTSGTVNLSVVAGNLTIRSTTGQAFQFSASQTVQAETQTFLGAIQNSETTYTSGTVNLSVVAGNLTIRSTTGQAYQFSASQTVQTQNFVALSATNTLYTSGTVLLTGSNMITVKSSAAGQTIILDATQSVQAGSVYASSNTFGTTSGTYDARTLSIAGAGQVSVAASNSGWIVSVPNPVASFYEAPDLLLMGVTQGIGASAATRTTVTAWVAPVSFPNDLAFNNVFLAANNSFSSATTSISSVNYSYSMGASLGFYTLNVSTMSLVTSFSGSLGFTNATSANATDLKATANIGIGGSNQGISITGAASMSSIMSSISSVRKVGLNWSTISNTLTRGQYWAVVCFTQLTGGAAQASLTSVGFVSNWSAMGAALNPPQLGRSTASATSPFPFLGLATLVNSSNSFMPISFNTNVITVSTAIANSTNFQSIWMQLYSSHSY